MLSHECCGLDAAVTKPGCTQTGKCVKFRCDREKKENQQKSKEQTTRENQPTNQQNQGEELKASTATPPPGKPHSTAWTRMQGGVNPKRSGTGQTLIYILYIGIYIYIIWKDTLRKQEIAAVSTVKRSYIAFRVTPRRKHTAEQSGGQRGTLVFWGGLSLWEGSGGARVSGPKALIHPLGAPGPLCPSLGSRDGVWG